MSLLSRLLLLVLLVGPGWALASELPRVVVVRSSDLAAYNPVVAGFSSEVRASVEEITLPARPELMSKVMAHVQESRPALVLAVGPQAATASRRMLKDLPILFTLVPYYERYGLDGPSVTGIALSHGMALELTTLAAVAPERTRVGILHNPRYSSQLIEEARRAAADLGLSVVPLPLEDGALLERVLRGAEGRVDALLMVADKTVAHTEVVRGLIQFSLEQRLPLLGLSGSQVQEGALLALAPSSIGMGQQAGRLANRIVHEKIDPGALAVALPQLMELSLNLQTANRLGERGSVALRVLDFAAGRGFPVRVYGADPKK